MASLFREQSQMIDLYRGILRDPEATRQMFDIFAGNIHLNSLFTPANMKRFSDAGRTVVAN